MSKLFWTLIVIIFVFGVALLWWGFIAWAICALLKAIGITTIGTWTVAFSWKLALLLALISTIFSTKITTKS